MQKNVKRLVLAKKRRSFKGLDTLAFGLQEPL